MKVPTPWGEGSDVWKAVEQAAAFPGMDGACKSATHVVAPVVHHASHVVLLPDEPYPVRNWTALVPTPVAEANPAPASSSWPGLLAKLGLSSQTETSAAGSFLSVATDESVRNLVIAKTSSSSRSWELPIPIWGIAVDVEQAWFSLGVTIGDPVSTISLAPSEERKIEVFSWERRKSSLDLETTDIVDRQTSTQLTTHDSYQVSTRVQQEAHWEAKGELTKGAGSFGASAGGSTSKAIEHQINHTRDLTQKVSEQLRTERKLKVSSSEEVGTEERVTQTLRNPNECHSLHYHFYEQLLHYKVKHAIAELSYAVILPNPLPEITEGWVSSHEGLLKGALLDQTMGPGFDAAKTLTLASTRTLVASAASALKNAFQPAPPDKDDDDGFLDFVGELAGAVLDTATDIIRNFVSSSDPNAKSADPTLLLGTNPSATAVWGYLDGLVRTPTLSGLLYGLVLVRRHYGKNTLPADLDAAYGKATSVISAQGVQTTVGDSDSLAEEAAEERQSQREREAALIQARGDFDRLKSHLEENLLHYMRSLWEAEDPAQRYARFASTTIGGKAIWQIAENRPLGFHLNGTIFPVYLGNNAEEALLSLINGADGPVDPGIVVGIGAFGTSAKLDAGRAAESLGPSFQALAQKRMPLAAQHLAARALSRSSAYVRASVFRDAKKLSALEQVRSTLQLADAELAKVDESSLLSPRELAWKATLSSAFSAAQSAKVDERVLSAHLDAVVEVGRWAKSKLTLPDDFVVSLPTGSSYVEATQGHCNACDAFAERAVVARIAKAEAEAKILAAEASRREKKLEAGDLSPNPPDSALAVGLDIKNAAP